MFLNSILERSLWLSVGSQVIRIIRERTLRGEFLPGSTGTNQYSTAPAPIGYEHITKIGKRRLQRLAETGEARYLTTRTGALLVILMGGYKALRELSGKEPGHVTLSWRGATLRNLRIVEVSPGRYPGVVIGFGDSRLEQIARYHDELGAGKRRVTHKFMGLLEPEYDQIKQEIENYISQPR